MGQVDTHASPLNNPPWAALTTAHRSFAQGGELAVRYRPDIAPFAALAEPTEACFAALAPLVPPHGRVALQTIEAFVPPAPFTVASQAPVIQMVLEPTAPARLPAGPKPLVLDAGDVPEMIDLTSRTRPGPFGPRTIELGHYVGIRSDGVLAAMAGERMRFDRYVEISAVCTDPAFRGRSLATLLMMHLAGRMQDQGLVPILHVFASNASAIDLYRRLGFVQRRAFFVTAMGIVGAEGA